MEPDINRAVAIVGVGAILAGCAKSDGVLEQSHQQTLFHHGSSAGALERRDYYDPDPLAPDKTYSKIGGWVRGFEFDWKQYRMPPRVADAMDQGQQWAVTIASQALADYGYPDRPLDLERTGVSWARRWAARCTT